jgi:hypothetical protein
MPRCVSYSEALPAPPVFHVARWPAAALLTAQAPDEVSQCGKACNPMLCREGTDVAVQLTVQTTS